jgi:hypothetical protein
MTFEIASTNLVIELGVILALLMGWQFTLAELAGGPLMIVFLALLFRLFLRDQLLAQARGQADRGLTGSMGGTPRWTCRSSATARSPGGYCPATASPRSATCS